MNPATCKSVGVPPAPPHGAHSLFKNRSAAERGQSAHGSQGPCKTSSSVRTVVTRGAQATPQRCSVSPTAVPARQPAQDLEAPPGSQPPLFLTSACPPPQPGWGPSVQTPSSVCASFCHCHSLGIAFCRPLRLSGAWCLCCRSHLWSPLGLHACNSGGCHWAPVPLCLNRVTVRPSSDKEMLSGVHDSAATDTPETAHGARETELERGGRATQTSPLAVLVDN